jgi:galactokinase
MPKGKTGEARALPGRYLIRRGETWGKDPRDSTGGVVVAPPAFKHLEEKMKEIYVPGRLCLFGEHSDWAATYRQFNSKIRPGRALVAMLDQGIRAVAEPNEEVEIQFMEYQISEPASSNVLRERAIRGGFMSYVTGAAYEMVKLCRKGIKIRIVESDLPIGAGLSSSAAACVLVVKAYDQVYGLGLGIHEIMERSYRGEIMTGSRCGRMDQLVAYGEGVVEAIFAEDGQSTVRVKVGETLYFVIALIRGVKDTIAILAQLHSVFPWAYGLEQSKAFNFLTERNEGMTRTARRLIAEGDLLGLGELMKMYQHDFDRSLRQIAPSLDSPILDTILEDKRLGKWSLGMKGVGSHGDGAAMLLCGDLIGAGMAMDYLRQEYGIESLLLTIEETP